VRQGAPRRWTAVSRKPIQLEAGTSASLELRRRCTFATAAGRSLAARRRPGL